MALNPSIALGVRPLEVPNQLAQYSQMAQLESAQNQNQVSQMQLAQMRRDDEALRKIQATAAAHGGPDNIRQIAKAYIDSGNPKYIQFGIDIEQKLNDRENIAKIMSMGQPPAAAPAAAPVANALTAPMQAGALGSGTFGMAPEPVANRLAAPAAAAPMAAPTAAPAAAPMAAPATPSGADLATLFAQQNAFIAMGKPEMARALDARISLAARQQPETIREMQAFGLPITPEGFKQYKALSQPLSEFERLLAASDLSPAEKANLRVKRAQKEATHAPGTSVYLPPQEKAFEGELGKGQAEGVIKSRAAAQDAAAIIDTVKTGRDIMKSGMITGAGADFLVNLNQGLKTAGIDAGYADASANSQAFAANMAGNVGKLIKQFGAGTGLSDADREFAKEMAGGRISLDAKAINRILEINEKAARNTITRHNKDVKGIKTNIPLEVEMPPEAKTPVVGAPSAAIEYLRANPAMKGAFDAKYGAGAADRALKGQ